MNWLGKPPALRVRGRGRGVTCVRPGGGRQPRPDNRACQVRTAAHDRCSFQRQIGSRAAGPHGQASFRFPSRVGIGTKNSRYRNKEHLQFVSKQACLICGRKHSDPHHLGFMQPRALGRKVSAEFVVPLCRRVHHRAVRRVSDEQAWWTQLRIDAVSVARKLWTSTRLDEGSASTGARKGTTDQSSTSDVGDDVQSPGA